MKKLYIHSGLPKTATSALQVFFAQFQTQLHEHGVEYFSLGDIQAAKNGSIASGNGTLIARSMLIDSHEAYYDSKQDLQKNLLSSMKNSSCESGLLSSEYFAVVPAKKLNDWKQSLAVEGIDLILVYYVRRQDQILMSTYMQRVKRHAHTGTPEEFILSIYDKINHLKYYGYTRDLINFLGENHVLPFIYETTQQHEKGIVGHFLNTVLNITPNWEINNPIINTSPSPLEIKFMLMANQYSPRMNFSDYLVEDSINRNRSKNYKRHKIVSYEILEKINNYFKEQNRLFEEHFGNGDIFPKINPDDYKDHVELETTTFTSNEVMDIISGLLVRFDRRISKLEK